MLYMFTIVGRPVIISVPSNDWTVALLDWTEPRRPVTASVYRGTVVFVLLYCDTNSTTDDNTLQQQ